MRNAPKPLMVLVLGGVALAGWLAGHLGQPALAQEADTLGPKIMCRYFEIDLANPPVIETGDRISEVGQWVGSQEDKGWLLYTVDFETAQKPTGYPQGWLQVCLYPGS